MRYGSEIIKDDEMFLTEISQETGIEYVRRCGKPFAWIVESENGQWWASIPGGDVNGYYPTRQEAIAAIIN